MQNDSDSKESIDLPNNTSEKKSSAADSSAISKNNLDESNVEKPYILNLYESREKVYPRSINGSWQKLRSRTTLILFAIYFLVPWMDWDSRQAILLDVLHRRFYFFDFVLWPQDLIVLSLTLLIMAFTLFFITALAGRLWCGYACPQTLWSEAFIWMERIAEGDRNQQIKLDKMPLNATKIRIKAYKYSLWAIFSLWTGLTFVGYFTPVRELFHDFFTLQSGFASTFWSIFYGFLTYLNAGYLREEFCRTMCPYARFQGAMYDENTLLIAYDDKRGEPRHKARRGENKDGHCIDCNICVQVCPVGIDIRDGNQYECIGCALCIDACNDVMTKLDAPINLIRYSSKNQINGKPTNIIRPKTIGYGLFLLVGLIALVMVIANVQSIGLNVVRDRNFLSRNVIGHRVENIFNVNILNKSLKTADFELSVSGIDGAKIEGVTNYKVKSGEVFDATVKVIADKQKLTDFNTPFYFKITDKENGKTSTTKSRFLNAK